MISSTISHRRGISDVATSGLDYYGESVGAQLFTAEELAKVQGRLRLRRRCIIYTSGVRVFQLRDERSIALSGLLTTITLLVVKAHLDFICCPKKLRIFFCE